MRSGPGQGSTFVVCLPVAPAVEDEEYQEFNPTPLGRLRARILCIYDEPLIAGAVRRLLAREHDVEVAGSGREAQQLLEQDRDFDLVLCDLMMPDVSGAELFHWIKQRWPALAARVVFISGGAFTPTARKLLEQTDNPRQDKPFDIHTFCATIRGLLAAGA